MKTLFVTLFFLSSHFTFAQGPQKSQYVLHTNVTNTYSMFKLPAKIPDSLFDLRRESQQIETATMHPEKPSTVVIQTKTPSGFNEKLIINFPKPEAAIYFRELMNKTDRSLALVYDHATIKSRSRTQTLNPGSRSSVISNYTSTYTLNAEDISLVEVDGSSNGPHQMIRMMELLPCRLRTPPRRPKVDCSKYKVNADANPQKSTLPTGDTSG